jgi:Ca2+-dependent lipid-binding protein
MDPFCKITARMQEFRTKTRYNEGKTPSWQEVFDVDVKYIGDDIVFEVWTENIVTADEMIGQFRLKISALCVNKGVDDWWTVLYKDKDIGKLHISSNWTPDEIIEKGPVTS